MPMSGGARVSASSGTGCSLAPPSSVHCARPAAGRRGRQCVRLCDRAAEGIAGSTGGRLLQTTGPCRTESGHERRRPEAGDQYRAAGLPSGFFGHGVYEQFAGDLSLLSVEGKVPDDQTVTSGEYVLCGRSTCIAPAGSSRPGHRWRRSSHIIWGM